MSRRWLKVLPASGLAALLSCTSVTVQPPPEAPAPQPEQPQPQASSPQAADPLPVRIHRAGSLWEAVDWSTLPGFESDTLAEAWNAWLKSCERPPAALAAVCPQVRQLSLADDAGKRAWLQSNFQPYKVLAPDTDADRGLLTSYFEPELQASHLPQGAFTVPLYAAPPQLRARQPWFSRQEIATLPQAQAALQGRVIAYLDSAVDAMSLQIQGSGRVRITEPDGQIRLVRLAFAGHNGHTYASIGRYLIDQHGLRDASWPGIKDWLARHPQWLQTVLWQNPRVVFFKEEALTAFEAGFGPRGAQGVALTPGRSIAVDPRSIPYGTPVWLSSPGPLQNLQRLVLAQDTGGAIVGAVRADYFAGWGAQAGEFAGRMKQSLQLWVLWPKSVN